MDRYQIRVIQLEGKSVLVLDGQAYRFTYDLQSTNNRECAIALIVDTLIELHDDDDRTCYILDSCKFGHLSLPSLAISVDSDNVSVEVIPDRRDRNRITTDLLISLTLATTNGNPHRSHARSSIIDVNHASNCEYPDFESAFDWSSAESLALFLYLDAIRN